MTDDAATPESPIESALKEAGARQEFHITNEERVALVELLSCIAVMLRNGHIWINGVGDPSNVAYANLAESVARKFANMPVHKVN